MLHLEDRAPAAKPAVDMRIGCRITGYRRCGAGLERYEDVEVMT
jgi:hypothetical protein